MNTVEFTPPSRGVLPTGIPALYNDSRYNLEIKSNVGWCRIPKLGLIPEKFYRYRLRQIRYR